MKASFVFDVTVSSLTSVGSLIPFDDIVTAQGVHGARAEHSLVQEAFKLGS